MILDKRSAIYQLGVRPEEIANTILLVGDPDRASKVSAHFKHDKHFVANFEMESSAFYGLCPLLGDESRSFNIIVANRVIQEFSTDGNKVVEALVKHSLDILATYAI